MSSSDTRPSELSARVDSSRSSRLVVHALLLTFGLILAYVVGGLIFDYQPDPSIYFVFSFVLFLFALGQSFYEFGGRRTIIFFVISSLIGFGFELLGITTGFLFGKYYYSSLLGPGILGVPLFVPLGWFVVTFITFSLALSKYSRDTGGQRNPLNFPQFKIRSLVIPIILSCLGTVAYDLMFDPAFSNLKPPYWIWEISSSKPQLYGVPLSNFVGWFVVALSVLTVFVISLKFGSKGPNRLLSQKNTFDSRIAYFLLMIDGAVINETLGQYIAVLIGVVAMSAFLLVTLPPMKRDRVRPLKQERTAQMNDPK